MRRTAFGDTVIESMDDDLGEALMEAGEDIYAIIREDEPGKFSFEVLNSDDGEQVASSEDFFSSASEARNYLKPWIKDIQI